MPNNLLSKNLSLLAAAGTLLSIFMILFGIFSSSYIGENSAESFIFLSPLPLAFAMVVFHQRFKKLRGNTAVFATGAIGIGTLSLALILSVWSPTPPFTNPSYAIVTTALVSGVALWLMGINWLALNNQLWPTVLCLLGLVAGAAWLILVISSISLWQHNIPLWVMGTNLIIWLPVHLTWLIWMTIVLFSNGRSETLTPDQKAFG